MTDSDDTTQKISSGKYSTNIQVAGDYIEKPKKEGGGTILKPTQLERIKYDQKTAEIIRNVEEMYLPRRNIYFTLYGLEDSMTQQISEFTFGDLHKLSTISNKCETSILALYTRSVNIIKYRIPVIEELKNTSPDL